MALPLANPRRHRRNRPRWRKTASGRRHYNYFRDYEPGSGRYIESDPIGLAGGISTYSYVSGMPMTHSDRQGLLQDRFMMDLCFGQPKEVCQNLLSQRDPCGERAVLNSALNVIPFIGFGKQLIEGSLGAEDWIVSGFSTGTGAAEVIVARDLAREATSIRPSALGTLPSPTPTAHALDVGLDALKWGGRALGLLSIGLEVPELLENLERCECRQ